ncbi:hypothetical protein [Streptomyces lydicus]|uniref:hypothetical protein n=1 Tax=Streptomyces lydicus TaxID=47763 RepID=UPI0013E97FCA|nr:hypothetical protein [Streptomyces lydicus]MCZ1011955.1 hypothetical protein [Streptomyces lydicus]
MANDPKNTANPSNYVQRLADAREANRKEQEDLQRRLAQLQEEEAWLTNKIQAGPTAEAPQEAAGEQRLHGSTRAPAESEMAKASGAVPKPRQTKRAKAAKKAAQSKPPAKKTAAPKKQSTAKKATAKKPAEPPVRQLVLDLLNRKPGEPHTAREVFNELGKEHPRRVTSVQLVRNHLEGLWKKKDIDKTTQKGSAMYSALVPAPEAPSGAEADQASETASKVPAGV